MTLGGFTMAQRNKSVPVHGTLGRYGLSRCSAHENSGCPIYSFIHCMAHMIGLNYVSVALAFFQHILLSSLSPFVLEEPHLPVVCHKANHTCEYCKS